MKTADTPPIPSAIWQRILAFIRDGRTGEVVLNVHQGVVRDASIKERIRDAAPEVADATGSIPR